MHRGIYDTQTLGIQRELSHFVFGIGTENCSAMFPCTRASVLGARSQAYTHGRRRPTLDPGFCVPDMHIKTGLKSSNSYINPIIYHGHIKYT